MPRRTSRICLASAMRDVDAVETDRAGGRLLEPEDGAADGGLAAAGFADQAERLARRDRERHVVDRLHRRDLRGEEAGAAERHREVFAQCVDLQQRLGEFSRGRNGGRLRARPGRIPACRPRSPRRGCRPRRGRGRSRATGRSAAHRRPARYGQRGAKRQPSGGERRSGGRPSMVSSRTPRGRSSRGTERIRPMV